MLPCDNNALTLDNTSYNYTLFFASKSHVSYRNDMCKAVLNIQKGLASHRPICPPHLRVWLGTHFYDIKGEGSTRVFHSKV